MANSKLGRGLCRRSFLQIGAIPFMGLGLSKLLASESDIADSPAKNIILVWLGGGPSTIDMWDLKPNAKAEIRGEFKPVSTAADGIQICEHMPQMAKQMDHCTLIRSVRHTIAEHIQGTEYVLTGNPISPALKYPSIGSIVSSQSGLGTEAVPNFIDMTSENSGRAGYLGSSHNAFIVDRFQDVRREKSNGNFKLPDGVTVDDLTRRRELLSKLERGFRRFDKTARAEEMSTFQQRALDILSAGKTRDALDVTKEAPDVIKRYGASNFGLSALASRRLVEAGVRFVTIGMNGWDTHNQNFGQLRNDLLPQLDQGLAALIEDLDARGLLETTVVYCAGEFNRTPIINAQAGRDHWARAMSVLVAGGNFRSGFVYGSTDKDGFEPDSKACTPADVAATVLNQVGIKPETILRTRSNRPMKLFQDASTIEELNQS